MIWQVALSPFSAVGVTVNRSSGAAMISLEIRQSVTLSIAANQSDWMTRAGLGFPL